MTALAADLAAAIDATTMEVDAPDADAAQMYTIGAETIRVVESEGTTWAIRRGVGTAIGFHSSGATLTPIYPQPAAGGGGGVTVTDGTTTVAATNIQMPAGTVSDAGGGVAGVLSMPTLIVHDATGGTITAGSHAQFDPTPVTNYTVVRDDIAAAGDPSNYPVFPAGLYLVGGYVSFAVPGSQPTGFATVDISVHSSTLLPPQGDLGYAVRGDIEQMSGIIEAPVKMAWLPVGISNSRRVHMSLFSDLTEDILWIDWVFWAVLVANLS